MKNGHRKQKTSETRGNENHSRKENLPATGNRVLVYEVVIRIWGGGHAIGEMPGYLQKNE
jgi:hypothetical protein